MQNISLPILTPHLRIDASRFYDLPRLKELYTAFCAYMQSFNGNNTWREEDVERILKEGDLPPQGVKERFQHLSIISRETEQIVGFAELYNGYPHQSDYYIGALFIDAQFQGAGFGSEIVNAIMEVMGRLGFRSLRISWDLKNWRALSFWFGHGFNTITKIVGDNKFDENSFKKLELTRSLVFTKTPDRDYSNRLTRS